MLPEWDREDHREFCSKYHSCEFTLADGAALFVARIGLSTVHTTILVISYSKLSFDGIVKIKQIGNDIHKFSVVLGVVQILIQHGLFARVCFGRMLRTVILIDVEHTNDTFSEFQLPRGSSNFLKLLSLTLIIFLIIITSF